MDWIEEPDGTYRNRGCTYFDQWSDPAEQIEHLTNDLIVPADKSHLTRTLFIDDEREADVTDYLGKTAHVKARSCILLEPRQFKLRQNFAERLQEIDADQLRLTTARNFEGRI